MLEHLLSNLSPTAESGLFTIGAAAVTGILGALGGDRAGKVKGRAEFVNAVEKAAELVITRLETEIEKVSKMHKECEEHKTILSAQVDMLMKDGTIATYHLNRDKLDG